MPRTSSLPSDAEMEYEFIRELATDQDDRYLGYEWISACEYLEPPALYAKAKNVIGSMYLRGWIEAKGTQKGRRGRPATFWGFTDDGWVIWERMQAKGGPLGGEGSDIEDRLKEKGKLRLRMPCDREKWREVVKLAKAGKINLILEWKGDE